MDGPFDARRVGASDAHLRVTSLSVGGCLIESLHQEKVGDRYTLEIELPYEGWIALQAETLYLRSNHEIAAKFDNLSDETRGRLHSVIRRLLAEKRPKPAKKHR